MTLENDKLHILGDFASFKSSTILLLFFALLLLGASGVQAQEASKKKGWAVKSEVSSEQKTDSNDAVGESTVDPVAVEDNKEELKRAEPSAQQNLVVEQVIEPRSEDSDQLGVESDFNAVLAESEQLVGAQAQNRPLSEEELLLQYDITQGAEPIDVQPINVRPLAVLSPELRSSLERQFQEIQTLKETEDAFSEQLGESYLAYGRTLMQAGRIDESRKMLVNALHIAKINNGVTSIEQRPILRELFEMNFALGNTEETEEHLNRIIWLEKKVPNKDDIYSFDLVVRLGSYYLDLYLNNPIVSEQSLNYLNSSTRYLGYAVNRYGDKPLSQILLPYGELALAHHFKSRIQHEVDRSFYQDTRQRSYTDLNRSAPRQGLRLNSFSRSERYLKDYLRKAKNERDLINTIQALLGLGDLNLLADKINTAGKYYDLAWSGAQNLPVAHPLVESFNSPVKLPSFNFAVVRRPIAPVREFETIPLSINVDDDGKVRKVAREALIDTSVSNTNRARRIAKRVRFRPVIENGKLIAVNEYRYEVQISVRKPKAVATKDSAE